MEPNEQKTNIEIDLRGITEFITAGVYGGGKKVVDYILATIFCYAVLFLIGLYFFTDSFDYDETDGHKRSGMVLRTDHGTGCQYLESSKGFLTPRLNVNGQPAGCKFIDQ